MSKPTQELILFPGAKGWEVWVGMPTGEIVLHEATEVLEPRDVSGIPAGDMYFCFPVKQITAVPMMVNCSDESLFNDLAVLHAERLGLKVDPMAGQLSDTFVVSKGEENSTLLSVYLRQLAEENLPLRSPKGFEISARALRVEGDGVALWQELGSWVFGIYQKGQLLYCQSMGVGSEDLGAEVAREIQLAMVQMTMQGIKVDLEQVWVWTSDVNLDVTALRVGLNRQIQVLARPEPKLPTILSKLLPEDVRAARREAAKRMKIRAGIAAVVVAYLGLAGWLGYGLWQDQKETDALMKEVRASAADRDSYDEHVIRWKELSHAVELQHSPVDILYRVAQCIPAKSGLRLKTADISAQDVKLIGVATDLQSVNLFSLKLTKANDLSTFKWQTPEPNQTSQGWEFVFSGEIAKETQP